MTQEPTHLIKLEVRTNGNNRFFPEDFNIIWENIQKFSIITGKNGMGKSKILKCIRYSYNYIANNPINIHTEKPADQRCWYIHFDGNFCDLKGRDYLEIQAKNIEMHFFKHSNVRKNELILCQIIGLIKYIVILRQLELNELNNALESFGLKFSITKVPLTNINSPMLEIEYHVNSRDIINLSCGEQIVLYFYLWKVISDKFAEDFRNDFKEVLLLLEEPDSSLNPSLIKPIISIIYNDIVGKLNVQVIMTTHNPSTVCFAEMILPENNSELLFLLKKENGNYIIENFPKGVVFNELNSGLINIHLPYRLVFVEGKDSTYYNNIYEFLQFNGYINTDVQIIFRHAGKRTGDSSCTAVESILKKIGADEHLNEFIFGIRDIDYVTEAELERKKKEIPNLMIPNRYSIENYEFDPLYLLFYQQRVSFHNFADFVSQDDINSVLINFKNEVIESLDFLPFFTENIDKVQTIIANDNVNEIKIHYINRNNEKSEKTIEYPEIFTKLRGKSLKNFYSKTRRMNWSDYNNFYADDRNKKMFIADDILEIFQKLTSINENEEPLNEIRN
ncbi:unnamed protein product [Brachionus calyciflorus]|uniref:ATPase AAA-type core domain-containing protein n=1 Tax=Brachionus calyciflorus TaxID=104777 RepID=A0A814I1K0_9BILA|nr:unnamed protein product [Brachionus calyciflorus]